MSKVLIIAEHDGRALNQATAKCVTCARAIADAEIHVAVFGDSKSQSLDVIAQAASQLQGVARVLTLDSPQNAHPLAAVLAPQIVALAAEYTHVFGPSTTFGKDLVPRVAALLDAPAVSDIMSVESPRRFRRPIYAGNAILTVEVADDVIIVATVRTASFEAASTGGAATVESRPITVNGVAHTRFIEVSMPSADRPDLQSAKRVISGGRALGSAEKFKLVYELADVMGAAVGASRAAVDAGYAANELQVGQTGKIISPELYIALGISGAIQHLTGIKDARTIVAINADPDAPIFESADLGLVGDLFEVVPALCAALQSRAKT
jgi:electron transfer flavoprotein alpha subunit